MNFESGKYNFKQDLNTGEKGENFMIEFLEKKGFKLIGRCKTKEYDLKMLYNEKEYTYEIKTDIYKKKDNIAIEFECRGNPSGISVTEADYFVTFFPLWGEIWNIKTENLRQLIAELKPYKTTQSGDDGSNTRLYLFKKLNVKKYFNVVYIEPQIKV